MPNSCLICERITPKYIFQAMHKIQKQENTYLATFNQITNKQIHQICVETCKIINEADKIKGRSLFCGRNKGAVTSAITYAVCFHLKIPLSQRAIAEGFEVTECTTRNNFKRLHAQFPGILYRISLIPKLPKEEDKS